MGGRPGPCTPAPCFELGPSAATGPAQRETTPARPSAPGEVTVAMSVSAGATGSARFESIPALVARDDRSMAAGSPAATRWPGRRQRLAPAARRERPLTPTLSPASRGRGGEMLPSPRQTPSPPLRGGEGEKCCPSSQTPSPPLRGGEEEMLCDPWRELPLTPTLSPASRGRRGKCCPPPRGEEGGPREREGARRGGRSGSVARRRRERLAGALYLPVHEHVPRDIPCSMTHAHALSRPPSAVAHSAAVRQPPDGTIPR